MVNKNIQSILSVNNLSYKISSSSGFILKDVSFDVFPRDFLILLGSNGSGKSSLLKFIDKRLNSPKNTVKFEGVDVNSISTKKYSLKVKTLTQNCDDSLFPHLTLFENFNLYARNSLGSFENNIKKRDFLAKYLNDFNPELSRKLDQEVDHLSGGEKQMFALGMTLLQPPDLLLLDEHTSALDPRTADNNMKMTLSLIKKHGITCILTTHNLHMAEEYGNRIAVLQRGQILQFVHEGQKHQFTKEQMYQLFY